RFNAGHLRLIPMSAEDDAFAPWGALPTWHVTNRGRASESAEVRTVGVTGPEVRRSFAIATEANLLRVGRPARVTVLGVWRPRDVEQVPAGRIGDEDLSVTGAD